MEHQHLQRQRRSAEEEAQRHQEEEERVQGRQGHAEEVGVAEEAIHQQQRPMDLTESRRVKEKQQH